MTDVAREEWLDAVAAGEGYYVESDAGATLPPVFGTDEDDCRPLPDAGELLTYSEVAVPGPDFSADAPYTVAIAQFGPV
jgi:uncharacterized protein